MPTLRMRRRRGLFGLGDTTFDTSGLSLVDLTSTPSYSNIFSTAAPVAASAPSVGSSGSLGTDIMTGLSTAGSILTDYYTTTAQVNQAKLASQQAAYPTTSGSGVVAASASATSNLMPWLLIGGAGLLMVMMDKK